MKIGVKPKARAEGPSVFGRDRSSATTENPAVAAIVRGSLEQWIAGESAPGFQRRSNGPVIGRDCDQIAGPAAAQDSDQVRQDARGERLTPNVEVDVSPHRNASILPFRGP